MYSYTWRVSHVYITCQYTKLADVIFVRLRGLKSYAGQFCSCTKKGALVWYWNVLPGTKPVPPNLLSLSRMSHSLHPRCDAQWCLRTTCLTDTSQIFTSVQCMHVDHHMPSILISSIYRLHIIFFCMCACDVQVCAYVYPFTYDFAGVTYGICPQRNLNQSVIEVD